MRYFEIHCNFSRNRYRYMQKKPHILLMNNVGILRHGKYLLDLLWPHCFWSGFTICFTSRTTVRNLSLLFDLSYMTLLFDLSYSSNKSGEEDCFSVGKEASICQWESERWDKQDSKLSRRNLSLEREKPGVSPNFAQKGAWWGKIHVQSEAQVDLKSQTSYVS